MKIFYSSIISGFEVASVEKNTEEGRLIIANVGRFSLFGVYIVHLGVLIIIAGAVAGSSLVSRPI